MNASKYLILILLLALSVVINNHTARVGTLSNWICPAGDYHGCDEKILDFNADGLIGLSDLASFGLDYNQPAPSPADYACGDGMVNLSDFAHFALHYTHNNETLVCWCEGLFGSGYDFGEVPIGGFADFSFTLFNPGGNPIDITLSLGEQPSQFSFVTDPDIYLEYQQSAEITIRFEPSVLGEDIRDLTHTPEFCYCLNIVLRGVGVN